MAAQLPLGREYVVEGDYISLKKITELVFSFTIAIFYLFSVASAHDIVDDTDFNLGNGVYITVLAQTNFSNLTVYNSTDTPANTFEININNSYFRINSSGNLSIKFNNINQSTNSYNYTINNTDGANVINVTHQVANTNTSYNIFHAGSYATAVTSNATGWISRSFTLSSQGEVVVTYPEAYTAPGGGGSGGTGGGGGGGTPYNPEPTTAPTASPTAITEPLPPADQQTGTGGGGGFSVPKIISDAASSVATVVTDAFKNLEKKSSESLKDILQCSKETLLFNDKCGTASTTIIEPVNWWILLTAFITAFIVLFFTSYTRDPLQDSILYGLVTIIIVQGLPLIVGANTYFMVYLLENAAPRFVALSFMVTAIIVTLVGDYLMIGRIRKKNEKLLAERLAAQAKNSIITLPR